jgi:hypothetical protein
MWGTEVQDWSVLSEVFRRGGRDLGRTARRNSLCRAVWNRSEVRNEFHRVLRPTFFLGVFARLKSCPVTKLIQISARRSLSASVEPCPFKTG